MEYERFNIQYQPHKVYDTCWLAHYYMYREFLKRAERIPSLDLCCGCGPGTILVSQTLGTPTLGVDYSTEALEFAYRENSNLLTDYRTIDLNDDHSLYLLRSYIRNLGISQVFWIEGIEHIKNHHKIMDLLLSSGVNRLFISTPKEKAGTQPQAFHINPFTPEVFRDFSLRYGAKILAHLKYVDCADLGRRHKAGIPEEELSQSVFTTVESEQLNYLLEIDYRAVR